MAEGADELVGQDTSPTHSPDLERNGANGCQMQGFATERTGGDLWQVVEDSQTGPRPDLRRLGEASPARSILRIDR